MTEQKNTLPKLIEYSELKLPSVVPQGDIRAKISAQLNPRVAYVFSLNPDLPLEYYFILYSELVKNCSELAVEIAPEKYVILFSHLPSRKYARLDNYLFIPEFVHQPTAQFIDERIEKIEIDLDTVEKITVENFQAAVKSLEKKSKWVVELNFTGHTDPLTALIYLALYAGYAQKVHYNQVVIF